MKQDTQYRHQKRQVRRLQRQVRRLKRQVTELRANKKKYDQSHNNTWEEDARQLQLQNASVEKVGAELKLWVEPKPSTNEKHENETLKNDIKGCKAENQALKAEILDLRNKIGNHELADLHRLNELKLLNNNVLRYKGLETELKNLKAQTNTEAAESDVIKQTLETENRRLKAEKTTLETERTDSDNVKEGLQAQIDTKSSDIVRLNNQIETITAELAELGGENQRLKTEITTLENVKTDFENVKKNLQAQVDTKSSEIVTLNNQIETITVELATVRTNLETDNQHLQSEVSSLNGKVANLNEDLKRKELGMRTQILSNNSLERRLTEVEVTKNNQKAELEDLKALLQEFAQAGKDVEKGVTG